MSSVAVSLKKPHSELKQEEFQSGLSALLEKVPQNVLRGHAFFTIPANQPPWFDTGVDLRAGEYITVLAAGSATL